MYGCVAGDACSVMRANERGKWVIWTILQLILTPTILSVCLICAICIVNLCVTPRRGGGRQGVACSECLLFWYSLFGLTHVRLVVKGVSTSCKQLPPLENVSGLGVVPRQLHTD